MNILPEDDHLASDQPRPRLEDSRMDEDVPPEGHPDLPSIVPEFTDRDAAPAPGNRPLYPSWPQPEGLPPGPRIPHIGDVGILAIVIVVAYIASGFLVRLALHAHLWGISTFQKAATDVHYTVFSFVAIYLIAFGASLLIFPFFWRKSLFNGLQWNGAAALRRLGTLLGAAGICFVLALVDELLLPGPTNAPIDKLFDNRAAAWLLFAYGVTFAPFFEEIIFRGFLLPAVCTAFDWTMEKVTHSPPYPLDANDHPQWSLAAMIFAAVVTSVPFALMHAEQTAWSLGPFLLLVCVSLVLCWARLATRSLAASVLVHASYNFLLFFFMLVGTSGFRHLDKM